MIASPHGQYVAIEDYEHLLIEKTQLATKTEALLHSLGTAKFAVHGSDIVCTETGVLGGEATRFVYGDDSTVEIHDVVVDHMPWAAMYDEKEDPNPIIAPSPDYTSLAEVLQAAYEQAAHGKGKERHARGNPFDKQHMQTISQLLGSDRGMAFQAIKKLTEGLDMENPDARERELLGAVVYIAGIVVHQRLKGENNARND
jgi:hypothetical protein